MVKDIKVVRAQVTSNPDYSYEVVNIESGEVLGYYDSLYLAKQSVSCINRNCNKSWNWEQAEQKAKQ